MRKAALLYFLVGFGNLGWGIYLFEPRAVPLVLGAIMVLDFALSGRIATAKGEDA